MNECIYGGNALPLSFLLHKKSHSSVCTGDNCGERGGPSEVLGAHPRHVPHAADPRKGATRRDGPGLPDSHNPEFGLLAFVDSQFSVPQFKDFWPASNYQLLIGSK